MHPIKLSPLALLLCLWTSFAAAQNTTYRPPQPLQDYEVQWWAGQGSWAGDQIGKNQKPSLDWWGSQPGDPDAWVYDGDQYRPVGQFVPHSDGADYVNRLTTHSQDTDLHAMRDQYNADSARMSKDTGATGQAMAVTNNSQLVKPLGKSYVQNSSILPNSVANMNGAGNNSLVAQTFSGCTQQVVVTPGVTGGNQTQERSCSYVQLKFTQGFAAHVKRTVTATFPSVMDIEDLNLNPAPDFGGSTNMSGILNGYFHGYNFPATTQFLTDFTVEFLTISGGPPASQFSATINTVPTNANNWSYAITVTRSAAPDPVPTYTTQAIWVRLHWDYQGDPVYTFTPPNCDQGDCTLTGDEFCKAKWTCNTQLPTLSTNGYLVPVTAAAGPPPIPYLYNIVQQLDPNYTADMAQSQICMDATLNIDCSGIYSGTACDANGCVTIPNTGTLPNDCPEIAADPTCHQMDTECADWGQSAYDGYCYVVVERFYCYVNSTVPDGTVSTQTSCPGTDACLDGSCTTWDKRNEHGYSRVQALGQQVIAQHFLNDWETVDEQTYDKSQIPPDPGATPGTAAAQAAALAEYRDMVRAQERKLRDHPELVEKLKALTNKKEQGQ